jgi:hypothetical protein
VAPQFAPHGFVGGAMRAYARCASNPPPCVCEGSRAITLDQSDRHKGRNPEDLPHRFAAVSNFEEHVNSITKS